MCVKFLYLRHLVLSDRPCWWCHCDVMCTPSGTHAKVLFYLWQSADFNTQCNWNHIMLILYNLECLFYVSVYFQCMRQADSSSLWANPLGLWMRESTMREELSHVWTFKIKGRKWKIKGWNLNCCDTLWIAGLACMPMFLQRLPFFAIQHMRVETQLKFKCWT